MNFGRNEFWQHWVWYACTHGFHLCKAQQRSNTMASTHFIFRIFIDLNIGHYFRTCSTTKWLIYGELLWLMCQWYFDHILAWRPSVWILPKRWHRQLGRRWMRRAQDFLVGNARQTADASGQTSALAERRSHIGLPQTDKPIFTIHGVHREKVSSWKKVSS